MRKERKMENKPVRINKIRDSNDEIGIRRHNRSHKDHKAVARIADQYFSMREESVENRVRNNRVK